MWTNWLWWSGGLLLIVVSLTMFVVAIWPRRNRPRRRWSSLITPVLGVLLGLYFAAQPKIRNDGWSSILPDTALIAMVGNKNNTWVLESLYERIQAPVEYGEYEEFLIVRHSINDQALYDWQWNWLARSLIDRLNAQVESQQRIATLEFLCRIDGHVDAAHRDLIFETLYGLIDDVRVGIRNVAAREYVNADDPDRSLEIYRAIMRDPEKNVRLGAVHALYGLRDHPIDPEVAEAIVMGTLQDPACAVRVAGLNAIIATFRQQLAESDRVLSRVEELARDACDDVRRFRIRVVTALQPDEEMWETLTQAIQSEDYAVRAGGFMWAASAETAPDAAIPLLVDGLRDEDEMIRWAAKDLLIAIGRGRLEPFRSELESLADDESDEIQQLAEEVLRRLE